MPEPRSTARILVGDDEIQICRLVRDVLRPSYDVDVTQDGRKLLERYHSGDYELLILDTLMVQVSGLEVVMRLRDRGEVVPIILMIGPRKEPDRVETFAFTYRVHVLRKPFGVAELRETVARALRISRPD
jgi:two-component system response regulator TrcR